MSFPLLSGDMKLNRGAALIAWAALIRVPGLLGADPPTPSTPSWPAPAEPVEQGRVGCFLERTKDSASFTVTYVAAMAPAARAGIRVGDIITAIDDVPAGKMSDHDLAHFLDGSVNGIVILTVHEQFGPD
jgi:hypothetical protein